MKKFDIRNLGTDGTVIAEKLITEVNPVELSPLWEKTPSFRKVRFRMACSDTDLFVYFEVSEPSVKAEFRKDGDPVWNDSCVELFIQSGVDRDKYHNFEFNAIGACLSGFGAGRKERKALSPELYRKILRFPGLETESFKETEMKKPWNLMIDIPFSVMGGAEACSEKKLRGNIYKCGNGMKSPHYMSWSPVLTDSPDFHCPEFFGTFEFPVLKFKD
ncbi:MAG: carbohydrate-binding family 9-like protein [Bacteroidales bacterium]|nr:carbohydrate-binding family 9-like protein [Bacteroidales bacterium]